VPCLVVLPAWAPRLTALDVAFGKGTAPHGFGLGKTGGEFTNARWNISRSGHEGVLRFRLTPTCS